MLQSQKNLRGIIAMNIAMLGFVSNDACMKIARASLETGQALVLRGMIALIMLAIVLTVTGSWGGIRHIGSRFVVFRAGIEAVVASLFITALGVIALADITAILMLTPLLVTAISMVVLREKIGWRRWSAVLVGFLGILLVVRPGGNAVPAWALAMAFASVLLVAVRDVMTRSMPIAISSLIITLASTLGTMSGGGLLLVFGQRWAPLDLTTLGALVMAALFALIGNFAVIEAHRDADLSVISPFRYSIILWALILGFLLFGEVPAPIAILGLVLVIGSGIYTIHRERVRRAEESRGGTP